MRRLLAIVALVVAVGATAAHAQDSNGYSGGWTDPSPSGTNDDGWPVVYLEEARTLSGQVSHANGIQRVTAVLVPDPDDPPPDGCDPTMSPVTAEQNGTTATFHIDAGFPCNLEYDLKATAQAASGGALRGTPPPYQMPLAVIVAIPPAPVGTVTATATADGTTRSVKLEWPANQEPDLLGYLVQRTAHDKTVALGQVDAGDTLEYVDDSPASGTSNRYDVVAVRRGPNAEIKQVTSTPTSVSVDVASRETDASSGSTSGGGESGLTTVVTGRPSTGRPDAQSLSSVRARGGNGAPSGPPTTFDSGFQGTLPFKTGDQSAASPVPSGDDPAVVATFDEGGRESIFGSKGAMTFIAGGLAVLVGAAVLFYVSRRAAVDAY